MDDSGWLEGGWRTQHEECCRVGRDGAGLDLVLIGDSLIQGWGGPGRSVEAAGGAHWDRFFGGRRAGNLGIAGDRVKHLLWRLEHGALDGLRPRQILLLIGTNDLAGGATAEETADGVAAVVQALRSRAPGARILVHPLLPRGLDDADPFRTAVRATNDLLSARLTGTDRQTALLLPATFLLVPDGMARAELFEPDNLHLSAAGYEAWGQALLPQLGSLPPAFADGTRRPLEISWIRAERQAGVILFLILGALALVGIAAGAYFDVFGGRWTWIISGAWAALTTGALFLAWFWPSWEFRHAGYCLLPDRIEIWRGLLWRKAVSIPCSRVQYTDVQQGPIQRRHGIATLVIHTAGTEAAQAESTGMPHALAVEVRDWLVSQTSEDAV
jgi:membrane protein YdbS with pleckstrin-like domain/lysophospholipase L1-like esterase